MVRSTTALPDQRGQAMTELILAMPVIAMFFAAVFYFGYGMNQKIENVMAVRLAAFAYQTDRGTDPDEMTSPITASQLNSAFFTRGRTVTLNIEDWRAPQAAYAAFATTSFNVPKPSGMSWWKWGPNTVAGLYLSLTGLPSGAHAVTRTTITNSGVGWWPLFDSTVGQTVTAELYLDQKTRKLESVSFNFDPGDLFDPTKWDFGYMPIVVAYTAGWDWDFANNCLSLWDADTTWPLGPCD